MPCTSCDGWGVVAPSALLDDVEPWPAYLGRAVEVARASGFPPGASAALAGLIRPMPCPACGGVLARRGPVPFLIVDEDTGGLKLLGPSPIADAVADAMGVPFEEAVAELPTATPDEPQIPAADPVRAASGQPCPEALEAVRDASGELPTEVSGEVPTHAPDGWCLGYVCRYTGHACFQSITGVADRILRSTCQPIQIHAWPTREEARAWMESKGLAEGKYAPVGHEFLVCTLMPFERDWHRERPEWFDQVLFEFGKPGPPPPPVPTAGDDALAEALEPVPGDRTHARGAPKRSKRELARSVGASLFGDDA